jgi:hypothetical protein
LDGGEGLGIVKAGKKIGRKAFVISFMSLILASYLLFLFSGRIISLPDDKVEVVKGRITTLSYHLESLFDYAEIAGVISSYSALQGILSDIESVKAYNPGLDTQLPYCILYGNLTQSKPCPGMSGKTITSFLDNITAMSRDELKIYTNYSVNSVRLANDSIPFALIVEYSITFTIADKFVILNSTRLVSSRMQIDGLTDPLYLVNGTYSQTIKRSALNKLPGTWTPSDLEQLINSSEYRVTPNGVSFANRIRGNMTPGVGGIESYINNTGPGVGARLHRNLSMVDHLFWTNTSFNCQTPDVAKIDASVLPTVDPTVLYQLDMDRILEFQIPNNMIYATC